MGKRGNREGSITKRKDGRYMARYTVQTPDGLKRPALYGRTRKEVAKKLARAMAGQEGGLAFNAGNLKVGEFLNRWLRDSVRDTVRPSTYERYGQVVRLHLNPSFGGLKLKDLSPAHVQGLYREKLDTGLSPASVQKIHVVLHKALKQAVRWSLVPRNATEAVTAPKPRKEEMRPLSREETKSLFEAAREIGDRLEALYVLAVTTGLLFMEGVHPKFVQELLGHTTIAITLDTYSHVLPSMGDQTAKAMEAALS